MIGNNHLRRWYQGNVLKDLWSNRPTDGIKVGGRMQARVASRQGLFFLLGMAFMGLLEAFLPAFRESAISKPREMEANARTKHPSIVVRGEHPPWGDFEYTRLPLEEPRELLPNTTAPLGAPRWFFGNLHRQEIVDLFKNSGLTAEQRKLLLDPGRWQAAQTGIYISPPPDLVLEMSRPAREKIYSVLDDYPANSAQCHPFRFSQEGLEEWFKDTGLRTDQVELLRKLIYGQNGSLCFCDGAIVQSLFSATDFQRFVKCLYGERTFLMKLRITPETDLDALLRYWEPGGHAQALKPLLASLALLPGGGSINVSALMPPFASRQIGRAHV